MRSAKPNIFIIAFLITLLGILSIYSSTFQKEGRLWEDIYKKQTLWVALGMIIFIIISNISYRRFWDWTYPMYAAGLFLLLLVFILGVVRLGAQRWLKIAWFNFQPSEFAKLTTVIFLARYFSKKSPNEITLSSRRFGIFRGILLPFVFVAIPMFLIMEQPDLGSAAMIFFVFLALLYLTEIRLKYINIFLFAVLFSFPILWRVLKEYQKQRLLVFLNPNIDPLGAGYTVIQSRIAIGSGGLFGKGWMAGTQSQLHFLPESHTDFIFATFAEQWGFLGSLALLLLYFLLIRQGFIIAGRTQDTFGKLLACGITLMLNLQILVNLAMTMGAAPVVGLPLPLMSYGGSSVVTTFFALGILVSIDRERAVF
ncbi:MAG: rod shape-determining protein RodA [Candidatus Omnitrophica bacterium]|nr:rod shape-determining protein RodA [Candidatus Omnitrophota bacterium]